MKNFKKFKNKQEYRDWVEELYYEELYYLPPHNSHHIINDGWEKFFHTFLFKTNDDGTMDCPDIPDEPFILYYNIYVCPHDYGSTQVNIIDFITLTDLENDK